MTREEIEKLVNKYIEGNCSSKEKRLLEDFLDDYQSDANHWVSSIHGVKQIIEERLYLKIKKQITDSNRIHTKKRTNKRLKLLRIASVFLLLLTSSAAVYFFRNYNSNDTPLNESVITLTLDNGNIKTINDEGESQVIDAQGNVIGKQHGKQLIYENDTTLTTLVYNTLKVPFGKLFDLHLSDGTHVFLNSGTSLRYPVKFIEGMDRNVYLKGEAYFKVAKDKQHPFVVTVDDEMNVRALGTEFNISSYEEDSAINTVLVEGSVGIYDKDDTFNLKKATLLEPDHKAAWDSKANKIAIEEVDTDVHTAWMDRKLIFKHTPFKIIRKKLERYYNVSIKNNNKILDESTFNASFNNETIDQVMQTLSGSSNIIYKIKDNTVFID